MKENTKIIIAVIAVIIIAGLGYLIYSSSDMSINMGDTNGQEENMESNGNIELETSSDQSGSTTFQYPADLGTTYISTIDWPPQLQLLNTPYTCTEAGTPTDRAGGTVEKTIGGRRFCATEVSEGAAGSIYSQYAYVFERDEGIAVLTFSLRRVQCGNYSEPEASACRDEQAGFDIDALVGSIVQTISSQS